MSADHDLTRRGFLATSAAGLTLAAPAQAGDSKQPRPRSSPPPRTDKPKRRLAVVTTAYHYLSHAYHLSGRFLYGYLRNGQMHYPDWQIAGMYVDQPKHAGDLSTELAQRHKFTRYDTVAGALTLGGDKLAVDGVLLIGEH